MVATATQLSDKFRKDVEKVSQDKVKGAIVQRLRTLFAQAPAIRAKKGGQGKWISKPAAPAHRPSGAAKKKRK
ncbi:hypothetical protein MXD81_50320 [Microbacteriaceae bacterium K1510]|nr:hypothetical protein [Microbacteriaceae bacterium K1510]